MAIEFELNGRNVSTDAAAETPLLDALRNEFELNSPRFGCGRAQCGACTVQINGQATRSCVTPVEAIAGQSVTTLEGLGNPGSPHPLQREFIAGQAMQCGYCISGIIMSAAALLERKASPSEDDIRAALAGHLCRCGAQPRMIRAIARAARSGRRP